MVYGIGKIDSAYRLMNLANSQMSMLNNIGPKMDMFYSLNMEKEKFNYKMLDNLDKMNNKIVEEKFKNK